MKSAVPKVFESDLGHMQKVPPPLLQSFACDIMTYDDLIARFENVIKSLKEKISSVEE